ncbi:MAG: hypothetical protein M1820_007837 [Bogoriella megaspora]|nr:MAG: hypothetical protein M1820_007837 [Bogoriella megaspora]
MGWQTQLLANWTEQTALITPELDAEGRVKLTEEVEHAILSLFPFLRSPPKPDDRTPLATLRDQQIPGSRGIVISTGKGQFRYACHLIRNLRDVLGSSLPIEIAYAGEDDLPVEHRNGLKSLGDNIDTVDVLTVFSDDTLKLREVGWSIKPFALLASKFEEAILMDADAVFLQRPEILLDEHSGYGSTGALLFHDRLLWQNVFKDRAKWWREQMKGHMPSPALLQSKVWMEGYAEEEDSGVIVLNKSSVRTVLGILHICWQNTKEVRDAWTYKLTYGDKESWWFGLELSGVPYAFEEHYGAVLGEPRHENKEQKVCGFSIAHLGEHQRLLWFNGSLLKNKAVNLTEYWTPTHWMVDAEWRKGATKPDMSCMIGDSPQEVPPEAIDVIKRSIEKAHELDKQFATLIGPLD